MTDLPEPEIQLSESINLREFCHRIPKVEIHCHLYGTIRKETLSALNRRAGYPIPQDELEGFYIRGDKPRGVLHIFRMLDAHLIQTSDDLYRITYEYLEDAARDNIRYSEFFWNPTGAVEQSGIAFSQGQEAIYQAAQKAEQDFGIISRLIPSIDREASPEKAVELVEMMIANRHPFSIGLGIDYREPVGPPQNFLQAYKMAKDAGFKTTAHAGEFGMPAENVAFSIDQLGVSRIDHGYTILEDRELTERCAKSGIVFTVVPTNSYYLRTLKPERWALDHPMRKMPAAGLRIHPNTDDPTFHLVNATDTWLMMIEQFGFGIDHLREFMINGLDGAWIDDELRALWKSDWSSEFDSLRQQLDQEPEIAADHH